MNNGVARIFPYLLALATCLHLCQTRNLGNDPSGTNTTDGKIWQPKEGTRADWMNCHGMPKDACERTKTKYQQLKEMLGQNKDNTTDSEVNIVDGCFWWTEEQIDRLITEIKKSKDATTPPRRKKRTLVNLKNNAFSKWPMPVHFKFDGTQNEKQKTTIRNAFQHWMDNTCVRFNELATNAPFDDYHILMTSDSNGCYAYVGRTTIKPQPINLQPACLIRFGTPVHEIGHTLGLWHEQMRNDRDSAIRVVLENLNQNLMSQFVKMDTDAYGVPYNYGSVMHYSPKDGSVNGGDTMVAVNPLYQMNMGQRTGLSFENIKIINLAYCQGACKTPLGQPCQRGGYQNPNKCSDCICPDGFSGQFCDQLAPAKNAICGGVINIGSGNQQIIKSPGYDDKRYYLSHQECSWWIKTPENYQLQLTFDGEFGLYLENGACYHWVEIKYRRDLGLEGARFCGDRRPSVTLTSQSNEMMIVFRSNYSFDYFPAQRGFQVIVKPVNGVNPVSTSTTSTSTTTSTPPTTTTTTTTTTRTATAAQQSLWKCSFETTSSGNNLCGMTQDTTDQFDWTRYSDPTPSDPTGPDFAYDGNFYIYIEASDPRQRNDEARLFFPRLNFSGEVCVDFYYHMFGFHINTLKLVRITDSQSTIVWIKSGQIGNFWLHASVGVNLSTNSQLQFVGIRGDEYSGDIGLDKIEVTSGPCVV